MRKLPVILTAAAAVAFFTLPASAEFGIRQPDRCHIADAAGGGSGMRRLDHAADLPVGYGQRLQFGNLRHCFSAGGNDVRTSEARSPRQARRRRPVYAE